MEYDLCWKTTFDERQPLMEKNLWWKTNFDGRQPLIEDNLWWKKTFGRLPLMEDNLWWKMTFDGRCPLSEDGCWPLIHSCGRWPPRKMTFDKRQPLMEDDLGWHTLLLWAFFLSCSFKIMPSVCLSLSKLNICRNAWRKKLTPLPNEACWWSYEYRIRILPKFWPILM